MPALQVLVAAPRVVAGSLSDALRSLGLQMHAAETLAQAEAEIGRPFALILVCYIFDDVKPYRLVHFVRSSEKHRHTPVLLVRALPVPIGETQTWEMEQAYRSIGVDEIVHHAELVGKNGRERADAALRSCVAKLLGIPTSPN